jgi:hypothetical protein
MGVLQECCTIVDLAVKVRLKGAALRKARQFFKNAVGNGLRFDYDATR